MPEDIFASSVFFRLTIAGDDLGRFHTCTGLGAQLEVEQFAEGGNNSFSWQLPTRLTWSNITFTRPVTKDTLKISRWLSRTLRRAERKNGEIVALRPDLKPIARWQVQGIIPISWQGPSFDPSTSQAAVETLEIAHEGLEPT